MWNPQASFLNSQLSSGERLLWSGQPRKGILFRASDIFLIPFSLMWGGFAIFWELMVFNSNAPFFFRLWGIPFVIVGLYIMIGRFFADAWQRSKTYYGVTNERVLIVSGIFNKQVKSLNLRTLSDITLIEKSNGSGTITFGPVDSDTPWGKNFPFGRRNQPSYPAFDSIQNAKQAYEIIRNAQRSAE